MFKNYFTIALRNLLRNKIYSFINIAGLSIGLAACLVVANVVIDDWSYDKQWKNKDIYRVISTDNGTKERVPVVLAGLGSALQKNFPEIKSYCRLSLNAKSFSINNGKEKFAVSAINTEPSFLNIFDFKITDGTPQKFINGYVNVIITQKIKDKYFPNINPLGKIITGTFTSGESDSIKYLITGIIKEIPYNTHLRADVILVKQFNESDNELSSQGDGYVYPLYVLLNKNANVQTLSSKVNSWYKKVVNNGINTSFNFQRVTDVYLYSDFANGYQPVKGSIRNVYIFSGVAIVLLLIACFNFINLTTARALKRMAETGIRKVLGAAKYQLIIQFLFESLLFFLISFILAIFLYNLSIHPVETYIGHKLTVSLLNNVKLFFVAIAAVLLVCVFTGLYPALILARIKPATILKGKFSSTTGSGFLRKSLVVAQFVLSITILIAAIVVQSQLHFLNTKDVGYDKNNLLQTYFTNWGTKGTAFKHEIKNISGVQNASITRWVPSSGGGSMTIQIPDRFEKNKKINLWFIEGDMDFVPTLKIKLEKGRLLNDKFAADILDVQPFYNKKDYEKLDEAQHHQSILLTAYAAKLIGVKNLNQPLNSIQGTPVGIINDFHNESLRLIMNPAIIRASADIDYGSMLIRINAGAEQQVINSVNNLWKKFYPEQTLQYDWVSDALHINI